jgi:hypothetical protein
MNRKQSLFSSPPYSHVEPWSGIINTTPVIDRTAAGIAKNVGFSAMVKRVLLAVILLLACSAGARAQCRGSGTNWSCPAGATSAQIQAALDSASDGAVITFAPGTYAPTTFVRFSNSKGATLICATAPQSVGAATANSCQIYGVGPIFGSDLFGGTNKHFYRISGFTFNLRGGKSTLGTIYWSSYNGSKNATLTQVRVDHNTFTNGANGAQTTLIGDTSTVTQVYGVYDHNLYTNATQMASIIWIGQINPSPPASQLGTGNNLFLEDNALIFASVGNASAEGCTDGWGGSAVVARHNTSTNCLWTMHGVTHAGGPANFEVYNNTIRVDAGAVSAGVQDCYRCVHHQGSGEFIAFNNRFAAFVGKNKEVISMTHYRDYANSIDGQIPICDGNYHLDGNRPGTNGYPCWHQPGRDFAGNLMPMYVWNNQWSDTLGQVPLLVPDFGGFPDYRAQHMQENREWYNAVSASAQTSPSTPFDGTSGMGFGTLANRPATCTTFSEPGSGVGYFATDQGAQGTLYRCSATNTWTVQYQPYTYPHPLVTSGPSSVAAPTNVIAVVN